MAKLLIIVVLAAVAASLTVIIAKAFGVESTPVVGGAVGGAVAVVVASVCFQGGFRAKRSTWRFLARRYVC